MKHIVIGLKMISRTTGLYRIIRCRQTKFGAFLRLVYSLLWHGLKGAEDIEATIFYKRLKACMRGKQPPYFKEEI